MTIGNVAGLQRRLDHQPVVDAADIGFWTGDHRIHHPFAYIALHNRDALRQRQPRGRAMLFAEVIDKTIGAGVRRNARAISSSNRIGSRLV